MHMSVAGEMWSSLGLRQWGGSVVGTEVVRSSDLKKKKVKVGIEREKALEFMEHLLFIREDLGNRQ